MRAFARHAHAMLAPGGVWIGVHAFPQVCCLMHVVLPSYVGTVVRS